MVSARIILESADLARIRLRDILDPLDELRFSAHTLSMGRAIDPFMLGWARRAVAGLGPHASLLMDVMTSGVVQVSSLGQSTTLALPSIDDALDSILSTPSSRWQTIIQRLEDAGVSPGVPATLADGQDRVHQLVRAMRRFSESALAPHWAFMKVAAAARRSELAEILATHGIDELLNRLHPEISWSPPVLTIGSDDVLPPCRPECAHDAMREHLPTMTICAAGRGLILAPSVFATSVAWWASAGDPDNTDPVVLTYPVKFDWAALPNPDDAAGALADLMGSTRSRLLEAIVEETPTTTELASLCRISAASASEHAVVLRRAGLITSRREGHRKFHEATALGTALVQSNGRTDRGRRSATFVR